MRYGIYTLIVSLFLATNTYTQSHKSTRVKAGEDIAQAYSKHGFYRFPTFTNAIIYFRNGSKSQSMMNFNLLSGNMQFIGAKKDTLNMGGAENVDSIVFEKTVFHFRENFMEELARTNTLRLLKKVVIKLQAENIGAYGQPNTTASIVNYTTFLASTNVYNLSVNQDVVIAETDSWFWMNGSGELTKATKSNLMKWLPADKQVIATSYLKEHKTNFEKEEDLRQLISALL